MNEVRLGDGLRGAALLITLAFVSGTAVVVIAMLSMSRQQVRHSTLTSHGERSRLGVEAAFEEAKLILLTGTTEEDYLVSTYLGDPDNPGGGGIADQSRYTFVSKVGTNEVTHVPLFAGGQIQSKAIGSDVHEEDLKPDLARTSLFRSEFLPADVIPGPAISHYQSTGGTMNELVKERGTVKTAWVTLPSSLGDRFDVRY
ncbi:MAG: hypothetical protein AAF191_08110, partial [Verrucomicrobiota bacterium]